MSLAIAAEPVPLTRDSDGVLRVTGTRIPLDTVVTAYEQGATPEEICLGFPTLQLDDVYSLVTYYLRHRGEVAEYLERRRSQAAQLEAENRCTVDHSELRARLQVQTTVSLPAG